MVNEFNGANDAIGTLVLKFDTKEKMNQLLNSQKDRIKIDIN